MSQTPPTLSLEIRDSLAFLTLARPEAANTMNLQFGREFLAAALAIEAARVRAAVSCCRARWATSAPWSCC